MPLGYYGLAGACCSLFLAAHLWQRLLEAILYNGRRPQSRLNQKNQKNEQDQRTGGQPMTRTWAQLKPAVLLFVLLLQVALLDTGSLAGAVAVTFAATAAAGSALAACSLIASRLAPAVPRTRVRTALRDREKRTAFLPQRDPDARGRRRPRAPGRSLLTAA